MYVFREFNQIHLKALRLSFALYLIVLLIVWTFLSFTQIVATTAFFLTLFVLLLAHAVRIGQLRGLRSRARTVLQKAFTSIMGVVIVLLVLFAYSQAVASGPQVSWHCFRAVLLSLALASWLSVYIDFAVADLLVAAHRT